MPDTDPDARAFAPALFQPERGLWIAPIRHHSPACAWAVRAMIRELRPRTVLIEGPADLTPLIADICDARTRPPVAAVMLRQGRAAYAPFCDHSPEYVAMRAAEEVGASRRFIDLPADRLFDRDLPDGGPIPVGDEHVFDEGDYVAALCARTGCRDGFELWDHLFEARLGAADWRRLLTDVGSYCAGLRAATPEARIAANGDAAREAAMAGHIAAALQEGSVVAVVGGFHAPALTDPKGAAPKVPGLRDSYLIRYGHAAMDALAGYGAGLPQPGFYDALWRAAEAAGGTPGWRGLAGDLMRDFTEAMAGRGHPVSLPAKVETLRLAETLAGLRGREAVLRHDLFDGVQAALTKGEVSAREPWAERLRRHWHGHALGEVPAGTSAPPLVEDARARATAHRLDVTDTLERRRSLDIHRKPRHLAASRFLHAMELLGAGFGRMEAGPDYTSGAGSGRLFEDWSYAWSPLVETRLIELAAEGRGETVPAAAMAQLWALREGADPALNVGLLARGIRAGLGARLGPFVQALAQDIGRSGGFAEIGCALQRLYGLCHTRGPMRPPGELDLEALLQVGYARLIYLADELPQVPEDMVGQAVAALRLMADLLASDQDGRLDRQMFDDAMARLAGRQAPPEIAGAALALALRAGQLPAARLVAALEGDFLGAVLALEDRVGVLRGTIATAPDLLWQLPEVLAAVDGFLVALEEDDFLSLLPVLRRALAALNPRETDRLAEALARRHGARPDPLAAGQFTEADLAPGLAAQAAMVEACGPTGWKRRAHERGDPTLAPGAGPLCTGPAGRASGPRRAHGWGAGLPLWPGICRAGPARPRRRPRPDADRRARLAGPGARAVPRGCVRGFAGRCAEPIRADRAVAGPRGSGPDRAAAGAVAGAAGPAWPRPRGDEGRIAGGGAPGDRADHGAAEAPGRARLFRAAQPLCPLEPGGGGEFRLARDAAREPVALGPRAAEDHRRAAALQRPHKAAAALDRGSLRRSERLDDRQRDPRRRAGGDPDRAAGGAGEDGAVRHLGRRCDRPAERPAGHALVGAAGRRDGYRPGAALCRSAGRGPSPHGAGAGQRFLRGRIGARDAGRDCPAGRGAGDAVGPAGAGRQRPGLVQPRSGRAGAGAGDAGGGDVARPLRRLAGRGDGMSALRRMLAAQDEAVLVALASPGLLRRAGAALARPGAVGTVEEGPDRAVLRIEGFEVVLGADGPGRARCDCPATGLCRHVLMAVLHLREGTPAPVAGPSARDGIAALGLDEIEAFAGADWPQALRIAALSGGALPEEAGASCVILLPDAPGAVTFVAGGGLRGALFKGPEGRRRRFVAAAALVLGGHALPEAAEAGARVDPGLLDEAREAVESSLTHGLRGDPRLAQERLFDLAVSARADAAPRLAAGLRAAARHAGRLAQRDPEADPPAWLAELAETHALIRALAGAPGDPALTGQLRRAFEAADPRDLAVLGVGQWRTPSGARGLTIHGWDGARFLSSGPARAAGMDPGFRPRQAYGLAWWRNTIPNRMSGRVLHLPAPRMSADGGLPEGIEVVDTGRGLALDRLPLHDDWAQMRADLVARQGIGLRATARPVPVLIRIAGLVEPRFDAIRQRDLLEVADTAGRGLLLELPDAPCGKAAFAVQHRLTGALIEALRDGDGVSFRLISLYFGEPVQVWNVTLDRAPHELSQGGLLDRMRAGAHRLRRPAADGTGPNRVALFADTGLRALADAVCVPGEAGPRKALAAQAEALGLTRIARGFDRLDPRDGAAVLRLAWELVLIRRAAQQGR
ncbi:MAG: DUF5682 family protein [Paracoccaceae bacterium]